MMKKVKKIFPIIMVAALIVTAAIPLKTITQKQEEPSDNIELIAEIDDYQVSVLGDTSSLPQDATVEVTKIEQEELEEVSSILQDNLDKEGTALAYDITLYNQQHEEIQPTGDVQVLFKNMNLESSVDVYHVDTDSSEVEEMISTKDPSGELMFETNHFSTYAIFSDTEAIQARGSKVIYTYTNGKDSINVSTDTQYSNSATWEYKYNLQIRVYENGKLLNSKATSKYFAANGYLAPSPVLQFDLTGYKIDSVYSAMYYDNEYNKDTVKQTMFKQSIGNSSLKVSLNGNYSTFLDVYITSNSSGPVEPGEPNENQLSITNVLLQGDLTGEDFISEKNKYYKFQIYGESGNPVNEELTYELVNNIDGSKTTAKTSKSGILMLRPDRTAIFKSTSNGGRNPTYSNSALYTSNNMYVKQTNGERYDTKWQFYNSEKKSGKQTEIFSYKNGQSVVFQNTRKPVDEIVTTSKEASISDWDKRIYDLNLMTKYLSNETTGTELSDVQLILDVSGSMILTDVEYKGTGSGEEFTMADLDKLDKNVSYFTMKQGKGVIGGTDNNGYSINGIDISKLRNKNDLVEKYHLHEGSMQRESNQNNQLKNKDLFVGANASTSNSLIYYNEEDKSWHYIPVTTEQTSISYYPWYKDTYVLNPNNDKKVDQSFISKYSTIYSDRSSVLISALGSFVDGLNNDINISIITFGTQATDVLSGKESWIKIKDNEEVLDEIIQNCDGIHNVGTFMGRGITKAVNVINSKKIETSRQIHTIVFTDGQTDTTDENNVNTNAPKLRGLANVFAIGVLDKNNDKANSTLRDKVASNVDQFMASDKMTDIYAYLEIISDSISGGAVTGDLKDVIDPAFTLIHDDGTPMQDGETIQGARGIKGTVHITDEETYVTWDDQYIPDTRPWNATLKVKAKEEFLGGNHVRTNGLDSYADVTDGYFKAKIPFTPGEVNVKTLTISGGGEKETVFWGDTEEEDFLNVFKEKFPKFIVNKVDQTKMDIPENVRLTAEEFNQLLSKEAETIEKKYSYNNNEYGVAKYSVTDEETDGSIVRTIKVEYIPNNQTQVGGGSNIAITESADWNYQYDLLKGELTITKKIDDKYTNEPIKPNQSFVFRIERRIKETDSEPKDVMYQVISFNNSDEKTKSATIKGLKKGYYTVIEETGWSWKYILQNSLTKDNYHEFGSNSTAQLLPIGYEKNNSYYGLGSKYIGKAEGKPATVEFTNHLDKSFNTILGDVARAINHLLAR